ncbi:beta-glucosidase 46-like isoform X3 [Lotus japonicus]|uniref:beta-glucosidase 46-like isoform X3 n=1 Tax=Lotus japonicus TaxID=34305 RepID=UPI00258DD615|nr:beta-glucosidase 46-like isoform X3 [Lotus japonicus]
MAFRSWRSPVFLGISSIVLVICISSSLRAPSESNRSHRTPLPTQFLFGTASSSYQYEGAYLSDGKGLSNWDVFTHKTPGGIIDGSNGDIAVDQYHRYLEDVDLMEAINVNSYRFSISWARVLPKGRFGVVNWAGISYYNRLIDALLLKGIQPFVTLSHNEFPQELEDRYGSWLSTKSREDFEYYADLCFKSFGDRVKYWATFNEPDKVATYGYRQGLGPPSRCSNTFGNCNEGDSEKEPFVVAHNIILSHAIAVDLYRTKYQNVQGGRIGIIVSADWYEPISNSTADKLAAERARSFTLNWCLDPIIFGKYPTDMQKVLGNILPEFSSNDKEKLERGLDFIGINHYASYYVKDCIYSMCEPGPGITKTEGSYQLSPIGEPIPIDSKYVYPQGMEKMVTYVKNRYNNTPMFISENDCFTGYSALDNPNNTEEEYLNDFNRKDYMAGHLDALMEAIRVFKNLWQSPRIVRLPSEISRGAMLTGRI